LIESAQGGHLRAGGRPKQAKGSSARGGKGGYAGPSDRRPIAPARREQLLLSLTEGAPALGLRLAGPVTGDSVTGVGERNGCRRRGGRINPRKSCWPTAWSRIPSRPTCGPSGGAIVSAPGVGLERDMPHPALQPVRSRIGTRPSVSRHAAGLTRPGALYYLRKPQSPSPTSATSRSTNGRSTWP